MKREVLFSVALCSAIAVSAGNIDVKKFKYAGPYTVQTPFMVDSVDNQAKKFDKAKFLDSPLGFDVLNKSTKEVSEAPGNEDALHLLSFTVSNTTRTKATIHVGGLKQFRLFVDGSQVGKGEAKNEVTLTPSTHVVVIKYLSESGKSDSLKVSVETPEGKSVSVGENNGNAMRTYNIYDVICGSNYPSVSLSADGKYMIVRKTWMDRKGKSLSKREVRNYATGKVISEWNENISWMPRSNKFYYTKKGNDGKTQLIVVNPATAEQQVLVSDLPEGWFQFTPDEKSLIYTLSNEGPKKDKDVYEVREPDDRQPGWRDRTQLAKYDIASGIMQPLTFGYHNVHLMDISADSQYILFGKSEERLTQRPTTLTSIYRMNLNTLAVETLVEKDGFVGGAQFSPDGKSVLIGGTPEAFGGIGKNVEEGQTPSMVDNQLFLLTLADKKVKPLTKDFNPSVQSTEWSQADGNVYLTAEDKDCINLFRLNPTTGKIVRLNVPEENIKSFSLASTARYMAFSGQGASNADRLYKMDTKTLKPIVVDDINKQELQDVKFGECKAWNFINSRGDTLCCRYYLPPYFDSTKKYPMVVNYYGGCSPTSRMLQSRYPHHVYAAMGYVVLVVNPSGATGFGQKFSARHVDTAGEGVAEDIIESTKGFCKEHSFVNDKKIGCIGASYGGFMTQYLQTKTDIFAAAISHAGISDHTSYWGEGYWGYSYSEVSMANEYPWTNKHLYVDQSPLYNADKIHTPLLFVHGTADHNVPVGESIQLYTALKLLGRPTAMVLVEGQDHHILDYEKRLKWQDTIFAWFAKWLQDDSSWWEEMYGNEKL